ncbi:MAG: MBL fold metallo-hydrolase [Puniceicoccales bacterium]|jgi:phosphoribosyl 1,2-cyclic phosphodiesterase|nr:MBL fold metallo-hydrolase [Puniceicoccales bacterium]
MRPSLNCTLAGAIIPQIYIADLGDFFSFGVMAISFEVLGSGSKGNCYLLRTPESNILIDVGFSGRTIVLLLERHGLSIDDIHAIFITHEHNDHCNGIRGLRKLKDVIFFANEKTAETINARMCKDINWVAFENERTFRFRDLEVTAFSLPHDAVDPVGYVFSLPNCCGTPSRRKICIITDLGYAPHGLAQYASGVDWLVIEANHDLRLLELDLKRPVYIKNRIRSKYGHLSNDAALSFISKNYSTRWKKITFVHLSSDCNNPEIIRNMLRKYNFPKSLEFEIADPLANGCNREACDQNSMSITAPTGA